MVTQAEWLEARKALLEKEKELTRATEKVAVQLRELPMVKVEKDYVFHTADGRDVGLAELFGGKKQLIIYHFMFEPEAETGCTGCSFVAEHVPDVRHLGTKDTAFYAESRAAIAKIEAFKKRTGWKFPWVSSNGSDFNYDFHVTLDDKRGPRRVQFQDQGRTARTRPDMEHGRRAVRPERVYQRRATRFTTPIRPIRAAWIAS